MTDNPEHTLLGQSERRDPARFTLTGPRIYVCQNCHRLGVINDFQDDCRPGWTHGQLTQVESVTRSAATLINLETKA